MNPQRVDRTRIRTLTDLPNVGKATAADLQLLGIGMPAQLTDADPVEMYERLSRITGRRHDPCVLDVFMSVTSFMRGEDPKPWWEFTERRKLIMESS